MNKATKRVSIRYRGRTHKKVLKKSAKILFIILVIILLIVLLIFNLCEVYRIKKDFYQDRKLTLVFNNNFGKCKVKTIIENNDLDKLIVTDLTKDGYVLKGNNYIKTTKIKKSCDTLYKTIKKDEEFKLNGVDEVETHFNTEYSDESYKYSGKNKVSQINDVDVTKIGEQYVIYKLDNKLYNRYLIRTVVVKDTDKPIIKLKGGSNLNLYVGTDYKDLGYTATDNYDGDITAKVIVEGSVDTNTPGKYEIIYKVSDSSGNDTTTKRIINVIKDIPTSVSYNEKTVDSPTYINGILIANKKYALPKNYNPGVDSTAYAALVNMQNDATANGYDLSLLSGFRSYNTQSNLYNNYVKRYGKDETDTFSARPGHSEHQTGLAFDIGKISDSFGDTPSGKWLEENCHLYGFIIRYPKDKQNITGYKYEPWHVRYLGVEIATSVKESGLTLEEYLGIN